MQESVTKGATQSDAIRYNPGEPSVMPDLKKFSKRTKDCASPRKYTTLIMTWVFDKDTTSLKDIPTNPGGSGAAGQS